MCNWTVYILLLIVGHEATGVVTVLGSDVKGLSVGSRIAIENHFFCESCYTCKAKTPICKQFPNL